MALPKDISDLGLALDQLLTERSARVGRYKTHTVLGSSDEASDRVLLVRSGIVVRFRHGRLGQRVIALRYPGEAIYPHERVLHPGIEAFTQSEVLQGDSEVLWEALRQRRELAGLYQRSLQRNEQIAYEWVMRNQMEGPARIAHFVCEHAERSGADLNNPMPLPLTQKQIAEITATTAIHVNRMLKSLDRDGLLSRASTGLFHADWAELRRLANFDGRYLL